MIARVASVVVACTALLQVSCVKPECAAVDYANPECRVIAENQFARLRTAAGVEVRFQDPTVTTAVTWDAKGMLQELEPGVVRARVAGPGSFALSLVPRTEDQAVRLVLDNVDPNARVLVGPAGAQTEVPLEPQGGTRRRLDVELSEGETTWVRGDIECGDRYRLIFAADIQTNPDQFERIIEHLQLEAETAAADGEPVVGLVLLGDLTEGSRDDEFNTIERILQRSPVPVAVTAGNHDIYRPRRPHYNRRFGPGNHSFSVCGTKMALLDTGNGTIAPSIEGRLPEFLDPQGASFLLVGMHHPPYAGLTGGGWSLEDRAQHLLAESAIAGVDLIVSGHTHALREFNDISVGDVSLREVIVGTGGAYQGLGVPRYGFLRATFDETIDICFVEVPPPGFDGPQSGGIPGVRYCD